MTSATQHAIEYDLPYGRAVMRTRVRARRPDRSFRCIFEYEIVGHRAIPLRRRSGLAVISLLSFLRRCACFSWSLMRSASPRRRPLHQGPPVKLKWGHAAGAQYAADPFQERCASRERPVGFIRPVQTETAHRFSGIESRHSRLRENARRAIFSTEWRRRKLHNALRARYTGRVRGLARISRC
jgi:hypothetical protein